MKKYRVTFYGTNHIFKTILEGASLEGISHFVTDSLKYKNTTFESEGKSNRHFKPENIEFIEYELLLSTNRIELEDFIQYNKQQLTNLLELFESNFLIATMLGRTDTAVQKTFFDAMKQDRANQIQKEMNELAPIRLDESIDAENEFIKFVLAQEKAKIE